MKLILKNVRLPLTGFSLEVEGEIRSRVTTIFGPSGAGKTSLLELVAGLRRPQSAFVQLDDVLLADTTANVCIPPRHRGVGYVPQDLALFPHLSVRQNLLYGEKHAGRGNPLLTFDRVVDAMEIAPLVRRRVVDLSGGEKQRVALARALLASPRLLLLDEPLASLDAALKARIIPYLARIRDEFQVPMLYVTHDRVETLALADDMIVLVRGKVAQSGPVQEVFSRPANLDVAGLLTIETVQPGRLIHCGDGLATVVVGPTTLLAVDQNLPRGAREVFVCIRAEDVIVLKGVDSPSSPRNRLPATVRSISSAGPMMRIDLDCGFPLAALLTGHACQELALAPGDKVVALVKAPHLHLIPRQPGMRDTSGE